MAIELLVDEAIGITNMAFDLSQVSTTLRVVYMGEIDYQNPSGSTSGLRDLKRQWIGSLDEVHPFRNALRADLVSLILTDDEGTSSAYLMEEESPYYESWGFNTVQRSWLGGLTFAHEIGHNLGCMHNRSVTCPCENCEGCSHQNCLNNCPSCVDNCDCDPGACQYSFGYNFPPEFPENRTIMAYPIWDFPYLQQTVPHFSNPDVFYPPMQIPTYATGVAPPSCNSADNASTLNGTVDTAANFRASCDTTDTTSLASWDFFTGQGDAASRSASISGSGQYMAFASDATSFVASPPAGAYSDVYLYNRESGLVTILSRHRPGPGEGGDGDSFSPAISGNGRFIAFASNAEDMGGESLTPNGFADIYVYQQFSGLLKYVNIAPPGQQGDGDALSPSISYDGRYVGFASDATNLVLDDGNGLRDIFVRDRNGDGDDEWDEDEDSTTTRVSLGADPLFPNPDGPSYNPAISAEDGQFVAFESDATNLLVTGDTNGVRDIFVRDRLGESTFRVSISTAGVAGDAASFAPSISADGRFVVFESDATNLLAPGGDNNGFRDIFVRDTAAPPLTFRASAASDGTEANGASFAPAISADGRFVAFQSDATNLLGEGVDTNGQSDVFVHDLATGETFRVSVDSGGLQANGGSFASAISKDGRFVALESDATNLVPVDAGGYRDIFFRDRGSMCVGDLNGDFVVEAFDLGILLGAWGPVDPCPPFHPADLNFDCDVGEADLDILLGNWGVCL